MQHTMNFITKSGGGGGGLLLDTYPAFAAYDVAFQLKDNQTQMIEVRNGGSAYEWIGPTEDGVLDEVALLAHCAGGHGFIRTIKDAQNTASTLDVIQTTSTKQPKIVNSGVVLKVNGKPAAHRVASSSWVVSGFATQAQPLTTFFVGVGEHASAWYFGAGPSSDLRAAYSLNRWDLLANPPGTPLAGTTDTDNQQVLITNLFNATSSVLRLNGTEDASGTTGSTGLVSPMTVAGISSFPIGDFQNLIIMNGDQTDNFAAIETAINALYEIYT